MKSKNVWIRVLCVFLSIAIMSNSLAKDHHARRASSDPNPTQKDREGTLPILENHVLAMQPEPYRDLEGTPPILENHVQQDTAQATEPAQSEQAQAIQDAKRDVEAQINRPVWFAIGCGFGAAGVIGTYFFKPSVPAGALLGKPPEYVAFYSDTYVSEMQNLQLQTAAMGCLTSMVVGAGCFMISLATTATAGSY